VALAAASPRSGPVSWRAFVHRLRMLDAWQAVVVAVAVMLSVPVLVIAGFVLAGPSQVWSHLAQTVLPIYLWNSLWLALGVGAGTLVIGVGTAWLTVMYRFPGRGAWQWLLLLPLALPAYIIAYTYTGMLDAAGPLQSALRAWTGWQYGEYAFPEIRSLPGAIVMLTLVLYPYVYLLSRAAFLEQSVCVLEVGRSLGFSPAQVFRRVALPLARPAIVAGVSLALMETLADYGTVKYFGVSTFTTGIFRTWFGMGEPAAAAQLAALLLGLVFLVLMVERVSRRRRRFHHTSQRYQPLAATPLAGWRAWSAAAACALPVLLGFVLPAGQLSVWAVRTASQRVDGAFVALVANSLTLAAGTALLAVFVAVVLAYGKRVRNRPIVRGAVRTAGMGYAVPGTVIAIGVVIPFAWLDNTLDGWMRAEFGVSTGLLLSGTLVALVFAYLVRFLSVSLQTVEAGLAKIPTDYDDTARALGSGRAHVFARVHMPLMRGTLWTAILLVFVDVMKELPATLILRPFDFNTLAVRTFELAEDEQLRAAAPSALAIVLFGLVPVVLLSRAIARGRATSQAQSPRA